MQNIKNLIGQVKKNKRAALAARTYELVRAILCKHEIREFKIWRRQRQRQRHKSMIWLVE